MTRLICGWCRKEFEKNIDKDKRGEFVIIKCPNCSRTLPASKKELTGNFVGKKHIHIEHKNGDMI